ncbi:MAG: transporter substrate-binding domain-containing protein [Rhodospirillales bacterium]|nr:transporter substrate-binding domain-containing protein [Rhodospirillales bacterium]
MKRFLAIFLLSAFLPISESKSDDILYFGTAADAPYVARDGYEGFLTTLLTETFKNVGLRSDVHTLPGERALINANAGIEDGDAMRIGGLESQYPNLLRIPTSFHTMEFVAFSRDSDITVTSWDDLSQYQVGFIRGWKLYEKQLAEHSNLSIVNNAEQLFLLLFRGDIEVALFEKWQAAPIVSRMGEEVHAQSPSLAAFPMYMYLHKKHANIAPAVDRSLTTLKENGRITALRKTMLGPWEKFISQ